MNKKTIKNDEKRGLFWYFEKYMVVVGVLGQSLFYVQGYTIFKNQSATDVSLGGFLAGLISVTSWLIYGVAIKDKVLVIANSFAVAGALFAVLGILIHGGYF